MTKEIDKIVNEFNDNSLGFLKIKYKEKIWVSHKDYAVFVFRLKNDKRLVIHRTEYEVTSEVISKQFLGSLMNSVARYRPDTEQERMTYFDASRLGLID